MSAIAQRGIKLGYTPDVLTDAGISQCYHIAWKEKLTTHPVADLSVMLALMAGRNGGETMAVVNNGEVRHVIPIYILSRLTLVQWPSCAWSPFGFCGPQLSTTPASPSRTIGFVGFGRISQATLKRLVPFGITDCVYYSNPSSPPKTILEDELRTRYGLRSLRRVDLAALARASDVVFVLAPGGEKTRHVVGADFLRGMKRTAVLVNTSRGTLVDSDALARALREGWIWGAGLDVVEGEPDVRAGHPLVQEPR